MEKKIAVIALGGNALVEKDEKVTVASQMKQIEKAVQGIIEIAKKYHVIITHGNGYQVGQCVIRSEEALGKAYSLPLEVCVAESEGELGFLIELALQNKLRLMHKKQSVVSLLSLVEVNKNDPAFKHPTKPIGPWYTNKQADQMKRKGMQMIYQKGLGYRRVVPSPLPQKVDDAGVIKKLVQQGVMVIAAGGGGIPIIKVGKRIEGIAAVIDKDRASACLAKAVGAELLLILTGVDHVYKNFRSRNQQSIKRMNTKEAKKLLKEGHFPEGSMGPKIEASIDFLEKGGKKVIITSPSAVASALKGKNGTVVTR